MELADNISGEPLLERHRVDGASLDAFPQVRDLLVGNTGEELEVVDHHVVGHGHDLAVHVFGRLLDGDVVAQALAHLLLAIGPHQQRHQEHMLLGLADDLLQLSAHEAIELLVGPSELDIGLHHDGIIGLKKRIEQLRDRDGTARCVPAAEVFSGQQLRDRELARQGDNVGKAELAEPFALPERLGALPVHHGEELAHVGLGVGTDLLGGEHWPGLGGSAGVADLGRPVTHYEHHLVPQVLELPQLAHADDVTEVDIGPARVEAHLEPETLARFQEPDQLLLDYDLGHAALQHVFQPLVHRLPFGSDLCQ